MILDPSLLNGPTTGNETVKDGFKTFPLYIRQESLSAHRQYLHVQPGTEINLTLEGKAAYVVGKQIYMQSPGQLILIPGHIPHQIYIDAHVQYKRAVICFDGAGLSAEPDGLLSLAAGYEWVHATACQHIQLKPELFGQFKSIVSLMFQEMNEAKPGWRPIVSSQFVSLAVLIGRGLEEAQEDPSGKNAAGPLGSVNLCCEYIDKHLHEDLSLQTIARMFNISPEHLTRQFKREKGLSFYQYVLQQRVFESRRMLLQCPDMSLTDIAYAAGFTSSAQFSRVFKSMTRMSPTQFRVQSTSCPVSPELGEFSGHRETPMNGRLSEVAFQVKQLPLYSQPG